MLTKIRKILETGWSEETKLGENDDYSIAGTKSAGQCYVTARTLSYICGWEILRKIALQDRITKKYQVVHYWNKLPDGREIDFTSDQYGGDGIHKFEIHPSGLAFEGKLAQFKPLNQVKTMSRRFRSFLDKVETPLRSLQEI
jgi:hypothetical protein